MSYDWKAAIGKVAPWLATTLGGPAAGLAVEGLCRAAGLAPSVENAQKAAEMAAAGQLSGEQFLALQAEEQAHQERMQAMGYKSLVDLEAIAAQDRASARNREIQTGDTWTPRIMAALFLVMYFTIQWYLLRHIIPQEMREIIMRTLGTIDMGVGIILGYYYGTSASSKNKDGLLYNSKPIDGDK